MEIHYVKDHVFIFNLTSNLGNYKLVEMESVFDAHSYVLIEKNLYFKNFIVSLTYRKVLQ